MVIMAEHKAPTVAVVGLGTLGIVAVKNLVEVGFDVTGFESNGYIGGLWHYTDKDRTSVLPTTVINISKERGCYTDFPFPDSDPSYCSAGRVQKYIESYAEHFDLNKRFRLNTSVKHISYDATARKWILDIQGATPETFDKVVVATGINTIPNIPKLTGAELFKGDYLHSRSFKRPESFKDKRVLVVGLGNTGADTIHSLRGIASKIYVSHSHGAYILPRSTNGKPFDHTMTFRKYSTMGSMEIYSPKLSEYMANKMITKLQGEAFTLKPEWRLSPAPSIRHAVPIVSDNLVQNFADGVVTSVRPLSKVMSGTTVELDDGTNLEVDSIIWCTGYKMDFSFMDKSVDPTRNTTPRWANSKGSRGKPLPRLYQNMISLDHPDSLAFLGCVAFATGAFPLYDLATMALGQIWTGNTPLPSAEEMEKYVERQHDWICQTAEEGPALPSWVKQGEWNAWANEAAGTGITENLGWGAKGWSLWWSDSEWYNMLVDGVFSPHLLRVFDGKRKKWDGAREAIEKVNQKG